MQTSKGKVMIVTGASSGIGRALVGEALARGMRVGMAARRLQDMEEYLEQMGVKPDRTLAVKADVSSETDCRDLIDQCTKHFGRLDVLVNNAGLSMRALFRDTDIRVLERLMQVNFWGSVYCTKYALPWLLKSRGSVVGVSSVAGFKGLPGRTGYSASKFALQGFLEALRTENRPHGLHVLIACPGFTASNIRQTALGADGQQQGESPRAEDRMMTAETVAVRLLNAIEKRKRFLVLTTQGKMTWWLNKIFPSWVDTLVFNHMAREPDSPFARRDNG